MSNPPIDADAIMAIRVRNEELREAQLEAEPMRVSWRTARQAIGFALVGAVSPTLLKTRGPQPVIYREAVEIIEREDGRRNIQLLFDWMAAEQPEPMTVADVIDRMRRV